MKIDISKRNTKKAHLSVYNSFCKQLSKYKNSSKLSLNSYVEEICLGIACRATIIDIQGPCTKVFSYSEKFGGMSVEINGNKLAFSACIKSPNDEDKQYLFENDINKFVRFSCNSADAKKEFDVKLDVDNDILTVDNYYEKSEKTHHTSTNDAFCQFYNEYNTIEGLFDVLDHLENIPQPLGDRYLTDRI